MGVKSYGNQNLTPNCKLKICFEEYETRNYNLKIFKEISYELKKFIFHFEIFKQKNF